MSRFDLRIDTSNAAFDESPEPELARIVKEVARKLENGERSGLVRDVNGNQVGAFILEVTE